MKQLPLTSLSLCLERHHIPQKGLLLFVFFFFPNYPNAWHTGEWRNPLRPTLACLEIWGTKGVHVTEERAYPLPWPPTPGLVRLEGGG